VAVSENLGKRVMGDISKGDFDGRAILMRSMATESYMNVRPKQVLKSLLKTDAYMGSLDRRRGGYQYQYDIVVSRLSLVSDAL
jgi:hypothetical protein